MVTIENRRKKIVELVNKEGSLTLQQLRDAFPEVSDVTIRKDLSYLDSTMQLVRTHGGAKSLPSAIGMIDSFYSRITVNTEAKNQIAQKALHLIVPNRTLYLAPGTTCLSLAKVLPDIPLRIFTDGIATAMALATYSNIQATVFGGEVDGNTLRTRSPAFFSELNSLHFDYAILGADSFHQEYGFVCVDSYSWTLLKALREHSDHLVILLDSSKVKNMRPTYYFPMNQVDIVVTDDSFDQGVLDILKKANVNVL